MSSEVNHHEHRETLLSKKALRLSIAAISGIFVIEILGGIWTNSLALLSDAAHVFVDLLSLVLSLLAILMAERPISDSRTFGWHRMEVFAALVNGATVCLIGILIGIGAFKRIANPQAILTAPMLAIACFGLAVNLFVIWKLRPHIGLDLNVKSAFVHAFGDAAASVAVVAGGTLVLLTSKPVIDPIAAVLVALIIMSNSYWILRDSIHILLEGAPRGLERRLIVNSIEEIAGSRTIKDFHIWNLCSHISALSVHLILPESRMAEQKIILENINMSLEKKFNIVHTTIQIESDTWHA